MSNEKNLETNFKVAAIIPAILFLGFVTWAFLHAGFDMPFIKSVNYAEAWMFFSAIGSLGAFAAIVYTVIYAKESIEETRTFSRLRLTVDVFAEATTLAATGALNNLITTHGSLRNARDYIEQGMQQQNPIANQIIATTIGPFGYVSTLYVQGALDKNLFLARAAEFIVQGFYVLEKPIEAYMLNGSLNKDVVTTVRDALVYRASIPKQFETWPEMRTYSVPENFPNTGSRA